MKWKCYSCRWIIFSGLMLAGVLTLRAQTNDTLTLVDVDGFDDVELYPVGNLQPVTDGGADWQPAAVAPAQIVALSNDDHGKVLRRLQTGEDRTDFISFPPVSVGALTIQFDARASVSASRTLDIFLLPNTGGETCLLGWGPVNNQLAYYNGTAWVGIHDLDTNWHQIELTSYLSGAKFGSWELKVDGSLLATNLPWRNQHPLGTAYGRLRIGGIRGLAGTYADVDNLVITATGATPPPEFFYLTNAAVGATEFRFSFATKTNAEYRIESASGMTDSSWLSEAIVPGSGLAAWFTNHTATNDAQFFRVKKLPAPGFADGYRGIWFTLGQFSTYGDKYSGGLGTYTANHIPIAIYAPAVNKTFFTYGGTIKEQRHLLIMVSEYDHATGKVPRPTLVLDKQGVNDPHDNASLALDEQGYIWVFVSGRARARPGWIFRSRHPYDIADFDFVKQDELTYPQPHYLPGFGFFTLFTKYTKGRELYWMTSPDGINWSEHHKLAGIQGHYQVSNVRADGMVATFFNRHPNGNLDKRTDLYYAQTTNYGVTWTTAAGVPLTLPLSTPDNPARVFDYSAQERLMYTCDLNFDTNGHPVLLYVLGRHHQPGPAGDPREWTIARWTGSEWATSVVCVSDHNYDMGSLYIQPDKWLIIAPTQVGPQPWQTGGEMALWTSLDQGQTWTQTRQITRNSAYNHTYARRPLNATDPFFAFWADGDPTQFTPSHLYFSDSSGSNVWQLPYDMGAPTATPTLMNY